MINLYDKTDDFIKNNKFTWENRSWQVRTCPISDFWSKFVRLGFKTKFLMQIIDDSAWFVLELPVEVVLHKEPSTLGIHRKP